MVFSLKASKKKIMAALVIVAAVVLGIIFIPKMVTAPMKHYGETPKQRAEFLESFGWKVSQEPIDSREVTIPKEFSDVYTKYNIMQKSQGFDLKPYSGMTCRQYLYIIENYPGETREIHATLLVYGGQIIGGDISCAEVDGFMHGFAPDSARYGETEKSQPKAESAAESKAESKAESSAPESDAQSTAGEPVAEVIDDVSDVADDGTMDTKDGIVEETQTQDDPPVTDVDRQVIDDEDYPTD